jgi:hypothetical protein
MFRHWIFLWLDARRYHAHALDLGPRPKRAVRQKVVAGDDRVRQSNGFFESSSPPDTMRPAAIVRIAVQDGVVEIEDDMVRGPAENSKLPDGEEFALQHHGVILRCGVKLKRTPQNSTREPDARQSPTGGVEGPLKRADPVAAADVAGGFYEGEQIHPVLLDGAPRLLVGSDSPQSA